MEDGCNQKSIVSVTTKNKKSYIGLILSIDEENFILTIQEIEIDQRRPSVNALNPIKIRKFMDTLVIKNDEIVNIEVIGLYNEESEGRGQSRKEKELISNFIKNNSAIEKMKNQNTNEKFPKYEKDDFFDQISNSTSNKNFIRGNNNVKNQSTFGYKMDFKDQHSLKTRDHRKNNFYRKKPFMTEFGGPSKNNRKYNSQHNKGNYQRRDFQDSNNRQRRGNNQKEANEKSDNRDDQYIYLKK